MARKYIDILSDNYRYVIIDNEAGMEHLSRLTTQNVNLLIIISDHSSRGVSTAGRIRDLVLELNLDIGRSVLIVNRAPGDLDPAITRQAEALGLELAGTVPSDETIFQFDLEEKARTTVAHPNRRLADRRRHAIDTGHDIAHQDEERIAHQPDLSRERAQARIRDQESKQRQARNGVEDARHPGDGAVRTPEPQSHYRKSHGDGESYAYRDAREDEMFDRLSADLLQVVPYPTPADEGLSGEKRTLWYHGIRFSEMRLRVSMPA